MLIHNDPNNINSIVYHLIIERYSMKILHWYFPWATALDLYNMTGRGEKLQQLHCYHTFSDSLDIYLTKNHYENYSPKMVPIAKIWGSGSWTICTTNALTFFHENILLNIMITASPGGKELLINDAIPRSYICLQKGDISVLCSTYLTSKHSKAITSLTKDLYRIQWHFTTQGWF